MTDAAGCEFCGLKPWDAEDLTPGDLVCVCDDVDELDPAYVLGLHMPVEVGGDYCAGSIHLNPMYVAVWLEYGRRGGVPPAEVSEYREWLAAEATPGFLVRVAEICAELERLTEVGDADALVAYLDSLLDGAR